MKYRAGADAHLPPAPVRAQCPASQPSFVAPALTWTTDPYLHLAPPLYLHLPGRSLAPHPAPVATCLDAPPATIHAVHEQALQGTCGAFTLTYHGRPYTAQVQPLRSNTGAIMGVLGLALPQSQPSELGSHLQVAARLAGHIAHDFNNLLTVVVSYSQFLLDSLGPAEGAARSDVETILQAARRGTRLVQSLLTFGQRSALCPQQLDLRHELSALAHSVVVQPETSRIQVCMRPQPLPCYAWVDPRALRRALQHVLTNALEAMPTGGTLTLASASLSLPHPQHPTYDALPPGRYACICLTDTGAGITPEALGNICEPFYSTKHKSAHLSRGMGLPSTYGILCQSAGSLWVSSTVGSGTEIRLYLPEAPYLAPACH